MQVKLRSTRLECWNQIRSAMQLFLVVGLVMISLPIVSAQEIQATSPIGFNAEAIAERARPALVTIRHYGRDGTVQGTGAGFVIASSEGLIATSLHVIGEARPIEIELSDGSKYSAAQVYAWDRALDLAILKIEGVSLTQLELGNSDSLKQGTPVLAMGNPLGLERSLVPGMVSARRDFDGVEMIQLAIPIEPGNSGGPLLDLEGRVHGVLTLKSVLTANLGFAVPINALKSLIERPNSVPMSRWLTIGALDPTEWTTLFGARWRQHAGRIYVDEAGAGFGGRSLCLSRQLPPLAPFELSVQVRLENESGAAGLVFGSDGNDKHFGFYPTAGQLRLTRFDGPTVFSWNILEQVQSAHYRPGDWNVLKVRIEPDKILCYVNGELVIESSSHAFSGNQVGLAKFRDTRASFRNFQVGAELAQSDLAPSPEIVQGILNRLGAFEDLSVSELVESLQTNAVAARQTLNNEALRLERRAEELKALALAVHRKAVQSALSQGLENSESLELGHAALLIAHLDNPDLEISAYREQLERMANEIKRGLPEDATSAQRLAALKRYLFEENGFHGSRTDYYNQANSYLNQLLDDREGLPITLAVLFLDLAERIGLSTVEGFPLPGHFVVRYRPDNAEPELLDLFEGGKAMSRETVSYWLNPHGNGDLTLDEIQPASKRAIVIRMLRNLHHAAQRKGAIESNMHYLNLIVELEEEAVPERVERALLRMRTGDVSGAKEDLHWLLEKQPPGIDLEKLEEFLQTL